MPTEGFGERRRLGEVRVRERNIREMKRTLEGPGSESRLARLRGRFAEVSARWEGRNTRPRLWATFKLGLLAFAIVVSLGILWPYAAPILPKVVLVWR